MEAGHLLDMKIIDFYDFLIHSSLAEENLIGKSAQLCTV